MYIYIHIYIHIYTYIYTYPPNDDLNWDNDDTVIP